MVFISLQDQFALALSQAVGSGSGKKEDELVGSKLNKVHNIWSVKKKKKKIKHT